MIYVFVSYQYSPDFSTPESWYKRTEGYAGIPEQLSKNNTVINIKQINYEGEHLHNGIDYRFVNFHREKTHLPTRINAYIKKLNPDVVIIQGLHNPLAVIQLHFMLDKRVKIIAHHHAEKPMQGFKKNIQRWADKYIDAYLFASEAMGMEWVRNGNLASPKKIHEVMEVSSNFYPIEQSMARSKTGVKGCPTFLWVGRLNDNKDPLTAVKAFLRFAETCTDAMLYMIYHTDELLVEIEHLLVNNRSKNVINRVGKVQHSDLIYWFNSADFYISASHYEGSGTALCEAMSCGCIPVITDIPSFRMITNNGDCGLLYEAGNEDALLAALLQSSTINKEEKRQKSLAYFQSKLSFESIAFQVDAIAKQL